MLYLVSVCSAELRTWTAINGNKVEAEFVSSEKGVVKLKLKSGKVFEVPADKLSKEDNEFIGSLAKPEGVNMNEELAFRKGIAYLKNSDTPYTGKAFALHENGQKQMEANYKDGKPIGLEVAWYENGQKEREWIWKDGNIVEDSAKLWNSKGQPVESFKEANKK